MQRILHSNGLEDSNPDQKEPKMNIQTFSIVIGTRACNAHCKFCVSHMTGFDQIPDRKAFDLAGFRKAVRLAEMGGCTTVLFTGKGEPTLYPKEIETYLIELLNFRIPIIELQTNAIHIGKLASFYKENPDADNDFKVHGSSLKKSDLVRWREYGLDTIAISTVGISSKDNKDTYLWHRADEQYPDLETTISFLHSIGFGVRLCVMMRSGAVDTFEKVKEVVYWAKKVGVEQITCRPIVATDKNTEDGDVNAYISENGITRTKIRSIYEDISNHPKATNILSLVHGAEVYDFDGQNLCMANCLTNVPSSGIRTLIYYSSGEISYDWQYKGAIIRGATIRRDDKNVGGCSD